MHTYVNTYVHTYIHSYTYIHTYIRHTYIRVYIHTYIYTHTYIHTCIHTYIHTYVSYITYINTTRKCDLSYISFYCSENLVFIQVGFKSLSDEHQEQVAALDMPTLLGNVFDTLNKTQNKIRNTKEKVGREKMSKRRINGINHSFFLSPQLLSFLLNYSL